MQLRLVTVVLLSLLLFSVVLPSCRASVLNWLLGRDSSPFSPFNSDQDFDKLVEETESGLVADSQPPPPQVPPESDAINQAMKSIPFELTTADEKFIADARKYTDLNLSELDVCQHKVRSALPPCSESSL